MPTISRKPNSWVSQTGTTNTQLLYALQVDPAPLTVSVANADPTLASLQFVITNATGSAIPVESIAFTLEVGNGTPVTPTTANIGVALSDTADWTVDPVGVITSGTATYNLHPSTGTSYDLAAYASVTVQLYQMQTVTTPGTSTIAVKETIQGSSLPGFTNFLVTTFPAGFFFDSLAASVPAGSDLVPVAQVATGTAVTLTWNASVVDNNAFKIYYTTPTGQQGAPPPALTGAGEWVSPALTCDTVFTVVATVDVDGGQSLTASLSTAVSVQNPTLVAASLQSGQATVTGATALANTSVGGTLGVTGNATLANTSIGGTLGVNGNTTLATTSTGTLTASSASVSGNLSVSGSTALAATAISGLLQASGAVGMMGAASSIGTGNYTAPTDGIVIGWVGNSGNFSQICRTIVYGSVGSLNVSASGGTYCAFLQSNSGNLQWWLGGITNTFTMPVPNGAGFSLSVFNDGNNQTNAPTNFYWIPIGAGSVSLPERTGEATVPAALAPTSMVSHGTHAVDVHDPSIHRVMDELSTILGNGMNTQQRERLHKAIKELVYLEAHKNQ